MCGVVQVVARLKDCIDDFKQIMPLVEELANPALKTRHWEQIFKIIDADIPPNDNGVGYAPFSVRMLLQVRRRARGRWESWSAGPSQRPYLRKTTEVPLFCACGARTRDTCALYLPLRLSCCAHLGPVLCPITESM